MEKNREYAIQYKYPFWPFWFWHCVSRKFSEATTYRFDSYERASNVVRAMKASVNGPSTPELKPDAWKEVKE